MVVAAENNPLWVGVGVPRGRAPFPCSFSLFIHPTICLELAEIQILFWAKPMELSLLLTFKHKRWLPQSWRFPHLEKGVQSTCTFFFGMKEVGVGGFLAGIVTSPPGLPTSVPVLKLEIFRLRKPLCLGQTQALGHPFKEIVLPQPLTSPWSLLRWRKSKNPRLVGVTSRVHNMICFLNFGSICSCRVGEAQIRELVMVISGWLR